MFVIQRTLCFFAGFVVLFCCLPASAQQDTTRLKTDSVNAAMLKEYSRKIDEIELQRKIDSTQRANLENQLLLLKSTDNQKKQELEARIQALKDKDIQQLALKRARIDSLREKAGGYPVTGFFKDTLFYIFNKSGSFKPFERADAITARIERLGEKINYQPDSLRVEPGETTMDIVYGDNIIMSISENDALWQNDSLAGLARQYLHIINNEVLRYRKETSLATLAKEFALALLVIVVFVVLIRYVGKLFRYTAKKLEQLEGRLLKGVVIRRYTLLDAHQQVKFLLSVNTFVKWLVILLCIYMALPVLFGIFPWTKDFAESLFGYVLNPVKAIARNVWNYLPNFITILVIVVVFRYLLKLLHYFKIEIQRGKLNIPGFYADWANPTYQIVRVLVLAFMIIVIFPYLPGSESPVFRGVSVFLGFLFTFGSAGSLSNIIAGLVLTYMRLFNIGDRVKFGDVTGDVIEKSMLVTRIRTIKNEIISIPNSTVMTSHTINYSSDAPDKGLIIHTTVTIGYDVPWRTMHQALIEAAGRTQLVLKEPAPFVLQTSLQDFYVAYQLNAYIHEANKQAVIYSELHQHIQDVCNEKGIEILSPHYRAARDGNNTTIPADYLPKDYQAPGFNVTVNNPPNGR